MNGTYKNLRVTHATPEIHARTCKYWYLVTDNSTAHTAFTTREGLLRWLHERGLRLSAPIRDFGESCMIDGEYTCTMHNCTLAEFHKIPYIAASRTLSNGEYVEALFTLDDDGKVTVHTMNPNCEDRIVFDYRISDEMMK